MPMTNLMCVRLLYTLLLALRRLWSLSNLCWRRPLARFIFRVAYDFLRTADGLGTQNNAGRSRKIIRRFTP